MDDLVVSDRVTIPAQELSLSFARSGGPGGQHVNKTESKVILRWNPGESAALTERDRARLLEALAGRLTAGGELVVSSDRTRDQSRNRDDAREKLAALIRRSLARPRPRRPTRPPRAAKRRRLQRKKKRSSVKEKRRPPNRDEP